MNKEVADLWVKALRSGEYNQATGTLVEIDSEDGEVMGHCCLGVLCELAVKNGVKVKREGGTLIDEYEDGDPFNDPDLNYYEGVTFDGADGFLPTSVREWAGMRSASGEMGDDEDDSLVIRNDSGESFAQIANLIETNYEAL